MSQMCRIAFCTVNSLFVVAGLIMCIGAVFFIVRPALLKTVLDQIEINEKMKQQIAQYSRPTTFTLLALGIVILSISSCGCIGVSFDSSISTKIYISVVSLIFFLSMTCLLLISFYKETIRGKGKEEFIIQIKKSYTGDINNSVVTALTDSMHFLFQCCGIKSHKEFEETEIWEVNKEFFSENRSIDLRYPLSCCALNKETNNFSDIRKCASDADSDEDERVEDENYQNKTLTSTNRNFPCEENLDIYFNKLVSLSYVALAIIMGICFMGFGTAFISMRKMKRVR